MRCGTWELAAAAFCRRLALGPHARTARHTAPRTRHTMARPMWFAAARIVHRTRRLLRLRAVTADNERATGACTKGGSVIQWVCRRAVCDMRLGPQPFHFLLSSFLAAPSLTCASKGWTRSAPRGSGVGWAALALASGVRWCWLCGWQLDFMVRQGARVHIFTGGLHGLQCLCR